MRLSVAMRGLLAALLLCLLPAAASRAATVLRVAYAGSMGVVMDRYLGPAFAQAEGIDYQGIGQGAYGLARLLAAKALRADVFVSITPGPIVVLQQAGLIDRAVPIASTQMVIAYSPRSRFAPMLRAAAQGRRPWWQVLQTPGLRFGRTDPAVDPQGQNIIFTMLLAERFYHQSDLVQRILGSVQNPAQIFTEPSLLSRLQAGQLDAASSYRSAAISHHLPYTPLAGRDQSERSGTAGGCFPASAADHPPARRQAGDAASAAAGVLRRGAEERGAAAAGAGVRGLSAQRARAGAAARPGLWIRAGSCALKARRARTAAAGEVPWYGAPECWRWPFW